MCRKKLIAPIIITILLVCVFVAYLVGTTLIPAPLPMKLIGVVFFLALIGVSVFVLQERVKEVRSGEEDDLGQY